MADVPLLQPSNAVAPTGAPGPNISAASTGGIAAAQLQDVGDKTQAVGDQMVMLQNQVRVNDAMNQARQAALNLTFDPNNGYQAKRGVNALQPDDSGQSLPQAYGQKLGQTIDSISSSLTPMQQRVFQMQAQDLQTNFIGGVQSHMLQQSQQYALSVQDSTLKLASDQAGQYWNQPDKINGPGGLVQQAQAAVYASGKLTGQDVQAGMEQAASGIHRSVIQAALENGNPLYAQQYADKYKSQMTTDDILRVQGAVTQQATAQIATLAVSNAVAKIQPAVAPTDMDRLTSLVVGQESGGHETNPDGSTVTSPKGAQGVMQVMPDTQTDPGFGVKPVARLANGQSDPADRARVGRDYLAAMVKRYGNPAQALAAYNAGPGAVDQAIKDTSDQGDPGIWLQALPKETQDYVTTILPKFNQGGGAPQLPTKEAFVQSAIDTLGPNATLPQLSLVRQQADARYQSLLDSRNEQGDAALRVVQQGLVANGGDVASYQQTNPTEWRALVQAAPGKTDDAMRFGREIANGDRPDNVPAYAQAVLHPDEMAAMPDGQFAQFITTNFSKATGEKLARMRAEVANGSTDAGPSSINNAAFNTVLKERLANIGLDPSPKPTDVAGLQRVGAVQKFLRDGIYAAQQQGGAKFTPQQISEYVDNQFRQNTVIPHWYGDSSPKPMLSIQWTDVPSADQAAINKAAPNASPTDKLRLYWAGQQTKTQ